MDINWIKNRLNEAADKTKDSISALYGKTDVSSLLAFLNTDQLLKWTESITASASTVYDKAMDSSFLKTGISGGNHRMFDGGHDLDGAWIAVRDAKSDDTFIQEVIAYFHALWKDLSTTKGLPFDTWTVDGYDTFANWITDLTGANKEWIYDVLSFDVMELFGSTLGIIAAVFALNDDDTKKLSEIIGSLGIVSILSANPIMGIIMMILAGYAFVVKKKQIDANSLMKGAFVSGTAMAIFAVLGLPILIEFILVLLFSMLLRKFWDNKMEIIPYIQHFYTSQIEPYLFSLKSTVVSNKL